MDLSGLEVETAGDSRRAFKLKDELSAILNDSGASYDYVLIDCPPSLSLLTIMALVASDALVVPLQTEFFALEGLSQLMKTIDRIKSNLNPYLEIRGILLTMFDKRNKLSGQVEIEARNYFKEKVYSTVVPRNVRLSEALHGIPVLIYDKICPGSVAYFNFTEEFLNQDKQVECSMINPFKNKKGLGKVSSLIGDSNFQTSNDKISISLILPNKNQPKIIRRALKINELN